MSTRELRCDQAIFTSVRSPTGEGYRIVAAGRGLKPEEKQVITRCSPSHEALCAVVGGPDAEGSVRPLAASFYSLPTGRLCVACSCYAGAEHTGRGGERVYTLSVVFDANDFGQCDFNPFAIVRAIATSGLLRPQLKPPAVLEELQLSLDGLADAGSPHSGAAYAETAPTPILERLFDDRPVLLNTASDPLAMAEWILAGIPGPLRAATSFCAGLRYSVGRTHRLQILLDEKHACRAKVLGQRIEYVDALTSGGAATPTKGGPTAKPSSSWVAMVERCWSKKDVATLLHRTSKPFADTSSSARERIGRLYGDLDSFETLRPSSILDAVESHLANERGGAEGEIVCELLGAARQALSRRLFELGVDELRAVVRRVLSIAGRGPRGGSFAGPLLAEVLRSLARLEPTAAAETLIQLRSSAMWAKVLEPGALVSDVATTFVEWLGGNAARRPTPSALLTSGGADSQRLRPILQRLLTAFPTEPAVKRCLELCDRMAAAPADAATH